MLNFLVIIVEDEINYLLRDWRPWRDIWTVL